MEAFKVWAALEIKGNALKQMEKFAVFTSTANKYVKELNREMVSLNQRFMILDQRLAKLAPNSVELLTAFRGLNTSTGQNNRSFERYNSQLLRSNNSTTLLADKTAALAENTLLLSEGIKRVSIDANIASDSLLRMGSASRISQIAGVGGGRRSGRSGGGGGGHLPGHVLSEVGMGGVGRSIGAMGAMSRFGGPAAMGALAIGMGVHRGYVANVEYSQQMAQFQSLGLTPTQMAEVQKYSMTTTPGFSHIDQIKALRDAQMATRDFSQTQTLAPALQKLQFVSQAMFSGMTDKQLKDAIRIAEIRGGSDPTKIRDELTTVAQMYTTSGGSIDPTSLLPFFRRSQLTPNMSRTSVLGMEPVIQEYGASQSATALQTLWGRLTGGIKLTERSTAFFEKIGLFKNGRIVQKYATDLHDNPAVFFKEYFDLLKKAGITSPTAISQANTNLGNTPSRLANVFYKNQGKVDLATAQAGRLMNLDQLMNTAFGTEKGAAMRFMAAFQNLTIAMGKASAPGVIKLLNTLAWLMEKVSNMVSEPAKGSLISSKNFSKGAAVTHPIDQLMGLIHSFTRSGLTAHNNKSIEITTVHQLDGKTIAKTVTKHQADGMTRGGTQSAPSGVNPMMTPQPAGINNYGGFN